MKKGRFQFLGRLVLLASVIILISGTHVAQAAQAANLVWSWRQPPYQIWGFGVLPSVSVVAWGGADGKTLYAGTTDASHESKIVPPGIYRSTDYGGTWQYLGRVDPQEVLTALVIDPARPNIVLAGFSRTFYQAGIYRSEDGGDTWTSVLPYLDVLDIEMDPSNPGTVYATGLESGGPPTPVHTGIYKSTDAGKTWEYISTFAFMGLAVRPDALGVLYGVWPFSTSTLANNGVYRSDDAGKTWTQLSNIIESQIVIDPNHRDRMYIFGEAYNGIWRTEDAGVTWQQVNSNLPYVISPNTVQTLALDPSQPDTVWIGLKYDGMYVSNDAGDSWQHASDGLFYLDTGITGPQCTTSSFLGDQFAIACGDLLYIQREQFAANLPSGPYRDGWILESSEFSLTGGWMNSTATTLRLGDDGANRQYRSILSFDLSAVPSGVYVTGVTLSLRKQSQQGFRDPFKLFNGLMIDVRNGSFNLPQLQLLDFRSPATKTFGPFQPLPSSTGWYTISLNSAAWFLNWGGITQMRLRFQLDDNNNRIANIDSFYSGNAWMTASRPVLTIEYCLP